MVDVLLLEDRLLFSASPMDVTLEGIDFDSPESETLDSESIDLENELSDPDLLKDLERDWDEFETLADELDFLNELETNLLFIDERVQNDSLARELLRTGEDNLEIIYLSDSLDGIEQITAAIERYETINSIQIVSHGSDGSLLLGDTLLSLANLELYETEISGWSSHLAPDADLLLLGCNVANTAIGESFVEELASLTGADIAASSDLTGSTDDGGDWELEFTFGIVQTDIGLSEAARLSLDGPLATFTVDTTDDTVATDGKLSLREAILLANGSPDVDVILFDIPDSTIGGAHTISLAAALPDIINPVTIDGTLEPDYSGSPVVFLDGSGIPGLADGLTITGAGASGSVVRGLGIVSFDGNGIVIENTSNVHVESNYIGVDATGTVDLGNTGSGIFLQGTTSAVIGGNTTTGNVISGNDQNGITVDGSGGNLVFDTHISGNRIGTDASGTSPLGNGEFGIDVIGNTDDTLIGGSTDAERNIISGNLFSGIHIGDSADDTTVLRNFIGTDVSGANAIANGVTIGGGIRIDSGATDSVIGSETDANVIAHNHGSGIVVTGNATTNHFIRGNLFFGNSAQPVDLGDDGATPNDGLGDLDIGPNQLQNFTDAMEVTVSPDGTLSISGLVNSAPAATYLIDFYAGDTATNSIDQFVGTAVVNTVSGSFWFVADFAGTTVAAGDTVYASIADQSTLNSSEFSPGVIVATPGSTPTANDDGPIATESNSPTVLNVVTNDVDPDGDDIRLMDIGIVDNGTVTPNFSTGEITYTSDIGFAGLDSFEYRIGDETDGTIHYWGFASDASDSVGGLDGTIVGNHTVVAGEFGHGLDFDGLGDSVQLGDITYSDSFTLSFAFKVDDITATGTPDWQVMYSHGDPSAANSLNIGIGETGTPEAGILRTELRDSVDSIASSALDVDITGLVGDSNWHTYTLVVSELGLATVYVDGVTEAITSNAGNSLDPTTDAVLGNRSDGVATNFFGGSLDTVRVFDRNLSQFEVNNLHSNVDAIATASFTVTGNPPSITSPASETLVENISLVHQVQTTTPNNAPVTLSVSGGDDAALFDIVGGELVFIASPSFESPLDNGGDNEYQVEVEASNAFGSDQQLVTITITNINENPIATIDPYNVDATTIYSEPAGTGVLANDHDDDRFGVFPLGTETLEYDASLDLNGNDSWETTDDQAGFEWDTSAAGVTHTSSPTNAPSAITGAWSFDGTGGAEMNTIISLPGIQASAKATFELWVNPADVVDRDIILDLGRNGFGTSIIIDGNQIELHSNGDGTTHVLTHASPEIVAGEYIHIVAVIDPDGDIGGTSAADLQLFVNGELVDEAIDVAGAYDGWTTGSNNHGLGKSVGSMVGDPATLFEGEVAMFRYYEGALTENEVSQQYASVATPIAVTAVEGSSSAIGDWFAITSGALVRMNSDGSFDYDANGIFIDLGPGVSAIDSFFYTVEDASGLSDVAEVLLTTAGVNNTPTAISIDNNIIAENDPGAVIANVVVSDIDIGDSHIMSVDDSRFEVTSAGILKLVDGQSLDFEGTNPVTIEITAVDRARNSFSETFQIFSTDVNDAPHAISISNASIAEGTDTTLGQLIGTLSTSDQDVGDTATHAIVGGDDELQFSLVGDDLFLTAGVLDFEDKDSYEVIIESTDSATATFQQLITIFVIDVNEAPEITSTEREFSADENTTTIGRVEASDPESDGLTFSIVGGADETSFGILSTGELFFQTSQDFEDPIDADLDNFYEVDVQVTDGEFIDVQRFSVAVLPVNDNAPVIVSDRFFEVDSGQEFVGTLFATDADLPGDMMTFSVIGGFHADQFGFDGANLIFTETQIHQETGNFRQVIVQADDGGGGRDQQVIFVRITNAAPVAVNDSYETTNVGVFNGSVLDGDTDIDDEDLSVSLVSGPASGTLQLNADGSFDFEPDPEVEGLVQFEYQVTDPSGNTDNAIVSILVTTAGGPVDGGTSDAPSTPDSSPASDSTPADSTPTNEDQPATNLPEGAGPDITSQREARGAESVTLTEIAADSAQEVSIESLIAATDLSPTSDSIASTFADRLNELNQRDSDWTAVEAGTNLSIVTAFDLSSLDFGSRGITTQTTVEVSQEVAGTVLNASVVTVSGVILGYLFWIIQSGVALSNLMTQLPMWNSFDPLPVLQFADANAEDDESLEDFVRRQSNLQQTTT